MDVHTYERWERVWLWWRETAQFKLEPNWFTSMDDAPDHAPDGTRISLMDEVRIDYVRRKGKWVKLQEITEEDCKMKYGNNQGC